MRKTRFTLTIMDIEYQVFPVYGDDLVLQLDRIEKERGIRQVLEGELTFKREDYDLIFSNPISTPITLTLKVNDGSGEYERIAGVFYQSYGINDKDNRTFQLERLGTIDSYEAIENGKTREFNIPDLGCPRFTVRYKRQPIIQVYVPGADFLTNINGGNFWEQPVTAAESSGAVLIGTYKFLESQDIHYVPGRTFLDPDIGGQFFYDGNLDEYTSGNYDIRFVGGQWNVYDILNGDLLVYTGTPAEPDVNQSVFTPTGGSGTLAQLFTVNTYTRMLSNAATIGGNPTDPIPANDIIPPTENYSTVIGLDYSGLFGTDTASDTPTPFPAFADSSTYFSGKYFDFPLENIASENYFPINLSEWAEFSTWFYLDNTLKGYQETAADQLENKDCYKFVDVLGKIVEALDPEVTHQETSGYSDFLYGNTNPIRGKRTYPFLTAKTNITVGDYTLAAKKALVTLQDLQEYARAAWQCSYNIDDQKRYVIEHRYHYWNGGSYTTPLEGVDLTTAQEHQHNLPWAYGTNTIRYKLEDIPAEIQTNFQEEGSPVFDGLPIKITSAYVNPGGTKSERIGRIVTDIDFGQINPVGKDGLYLLECSLDEGIYEVEFTDITFRGKVYKLQNGKASFAYMHKQYYEILLPAPDAEINGEPVTAGNVERNVIQEIDFMGNDGENTNYLALARTGQGLGEIVKGKVIISTGIIEVSELRIEL